jgi:hypothetical protein
LILEDIETKLKEIDPEVHYGMVTYDEDEAKNKDWNYIVFSRKVMRSSDNKKSYSDVFQVAIVRENYIADGLCEQVIDKMCEIAGMRLASTDCEYTYVKKPNTQKVVELLTIEFIRARKVVA